MENCFLPTRGASACFRLRSGWSWALLLMTLCTAQAALAVNAPLNPPAQRLRAELGGVAASADVRMVSDWIMRKNKHKGRPFIVVDKKGGMLFAFEANGHLLAGSPGLFGAMHSDVLTTAQAAKSIDDVGESDKITPAGVFRGEAYKSPSYGNAVRFARYANSNLLIHRAFNSERMRLLKSPTLSDRRITYGCINVPPAFMDHVLVTHFGGESTVFVLPENQSARSFFSIHEAPGPLTPAEIAAADEPLIVAVAARAVETMPPGNAARGNPDQTPDKPYNDPAPVVVTDLRGELRKKIN